MVIADGALPVGLGPAALEAAVLVNGRDAACAGNQARC